MTPTRTRVATTTKNGKAYNAFVTPGTRGLFQFESLADAGMIVVECCGQENVYFEFVSDEGFNEAGYCKCL